MLITIITVNYNDKLGLERTIKSVQNQKYSDFEFIVIDGNSNDGSKEIIEANQSSFNYYVSEPDHGIYHAMNKGIEKAQGEYILFLNSGDHFESERALEKIQHTLCGEDIVYFNIHVVGQENNYIKKCPKVLSFRYLYDNLPAHQATFFKKTLFDTYGYYDESLKISADWKFLILAICKHNVSYKYVDDTFSVYYADGLSSKPENKKIMEAERTTVLENEFPVFAADIKNNYVVERKLRDLRKSKILKMLVWLGLIHKF